MGSDTKVIHTFIASETRERLDRLLADTPFDLRSILMMGISELPSDGSWIGREAPDRMRTTVFHLRVPPDEHKRVKDLATQIGMPMGGLVDYAVTAFERWVDASPTWLRRGETAPKFELEEPD